MRSSQLEPASSLPCAVDATRFVPQTTSRKSEATETGYRAPVKTAPGGYYEQNKDSYRLRRYGYQAAPGGVVFEFTAAEKSARFALWGGRCWMCGIEGATQEDHVKPISKGGSHCLANLRPICHSCNASKGGRWPLAEAELAANFLHPHPRAGKDKNASRMPRVEWTCPQCNTTSLIRAHRVETMKYCSNACSYEARRARLVVKTCLNAHCAREFELVLLLGVRPGLPETGPPTGAQ